MNFLLLEQEESYERRVVLMGTRAEALSQRHDLKVGRTIKVVVRGGQRGQALVQQLDSELLVLELNLLDSGPAILPIHLIVAVPRPQMVRRIVEFCAMAGVQSVDFIRSTGVIKSYLQSPALGPSEIEVCICKGLEQSGGTIPPEVRVHQSFRPFIEDYLPQALKSAATDPLLVVADGRGLKSLSNLEYFQHERPIWTAVGPESGWNEFELSCFSKLGFQLVQLGERVLRVDWAATWLVSQLELLRRMHRKDVDGVGGLADG